MLTVRYAVFWKYKSFQFESYRGIILFKPIKEGIGLSELAGIIHLYYIINYNVKPQF